MLRRPYPSPTRRFLRPFWLRLPVRLPAIGSWLRSFWPLSRCRRWPEAADVLLLTPSLSYVAFAMNAYPGPLFCIDRFYGCNPLPQGQPAIPAYGQFGPPRESGWRRFFHARRAAGAVSPLLERYHRTPVDA